MCVCACARVCVVCVLCVCCVCVCVEARSWLLVPHAGQGPLDVRHPLLRARDGHSAALLPARALEEEEEEEEPKSV